MHASVILSCLLGAGAIAQPRLKHAGLHRHNHKRDEVEIFREGNEMVEEHIVDAYVTVTPGQAPATTPATVVAPEKLAVAVVPSPSSSAAPAPVSSSTPVVAPAPLETQAAPESSTAVVASTTPQATTESTPSTGTTSAQDGYWSELPMSPIGGGSGAVDLITSANKWRKHWLADSPPVVDYTWNPTVANNSYYTEMVVMNHGQSMVHSLLAGPPNQAFSSAQNEAAGRGNGQMNATAEKVTGIALTPFEEAWFMWMCEMPNAQISTMCRQLGWNWESDSSETGHAENIKAPFTSFGCYYMNATNADGSPYVNGPIPNDYNGFWTCDYATYAS